MRIAGTGILAGLALATMAALTILLLLSAIDTTDAATGTHDGSPGSIASWSVDTDPTGNTVPLEASGQLQGTINACKVVTNGSTFDVDFILDEINPADKTSGGEFNLTYNGSILQVNAILLPPTAADFTNIGDDPFYTLPDSSGQIEPAYGLFGAVPDGELNFIRITFQAIGAGSSALDISDGIIVPDPDPPPPDIVPIGSMVDGSIAVGGACGTVTTPPTTATPTPTSCEPNCPSVTPTPTPSPTATPTPSGPTPTQCVECTPSPTPTPSPTLPPGNEVIWGDNNCSNEPPDPVDSLLTLRFDAGLPANTGDCPEMGDVVEVASASPHPWGDVDCSGDPPDPVDSLKLLRFDAGLTVTQPADCPEIGDTVTIVVS
ncbi:MAG: cohesin domain-containing protein [Dehalococcoidia bacterium]